MPATHHLSPNIQTNFGPYPYNFNSRLTNTSGNHNNVRFLCLDQSQWNWIQTPEITKKIRDCYPNVQDLALVNPDLTSDSSYCLPLLYAPFKDSPQQLTSLSVERCVSVVNPKAFLRLICMFPMLNNLCINNITMENGSSLPQESATGPRFRGKLTFWNIYEPPGTCTIAPLLHLWVEFSEVCLINCCFDKPQGLNGLFVACKGTVKKVQISKVMIYNLLEHGPFH